jgi:hypothetical protein
VTVLARVAELLDAAARDLWARAEAQGPLGAAYTLANDLHLTADLAAGLVLDGAQSQLLAGGTAIADDPVATLTEATSLLTSVPIEALPEGTSRLLVRLADLTRQVGA